MTISPDQPSRILIIDDTSANRYALGHLLRRNGYDVAEATTWTEGLAMLDGIDLLVLDVQLPEKNGFEACQELKQNPATASIPILMTSAAFVEGRDKALGFDSGADGYITAPVDQHELIATVRSLLRMRKAEEQLRTAYQKAESANDAKTEFLTNMSHEIRTPMNAIIGLSKILSMTTLTPKQQEFVTTLQASADSLLELINDMLDIARIEDRMITMEKVPFSLRALIDQVNEMMSVKAAEKNLQLSVSYHGGVLDSYVGDPMRIQQIIVNLVGNAIKFTAAGSVRIEVRDFGEPLPSMDSAMRNIAIRVVDTGIGVPRDKQQAIFDKFTQGDSSVARKYGGSGLGLTISKALAEQMGGTIDVDSEAGAGATFTVNLPLGFSGPAADGPQPDAALPGERPNKAKILLVEDYKPNILVAETLLTEYGYGVDVATSGRDALQRFSEGPYDVILMDIQMQDIDGYDTTRAIRQIEQMDALGRTPIIAMTAHALAGDREKCLEAGMDDYVSKPFNGEDLRARIETLTGAAKSA